MPDATPIVDADSLLSDIEDTGSTRFLSLICPPFRNLKSHHSALIAYAQGIKARLTSLQDENQALIEQHATLESENKLLDQAVLNIHQQLESTSLSLKEMRAKFDENSREKDDLEKRYKLVSDAISSKIDVTPKYQALVEIFYDEFLPFANSINVLKEEANAIIRMRAAVDQLRVIESMSRFKDKTVVALSGGFSSGKSTFINSMFSNHNVHLPVGIERMTAIPSYVGHGEETRIIGYSANGGIVDIPADMYGRLSHAYIDAFSFNLRDLLPFVAIETPLDGLENISFIDLPGYDPGRSHAHTDGDSAAASEFLEQAHALIWVIGLDANGTLPRSDIEFLLEHTEHVENLYVIVNKADLKPSSDIQAVIEEVKDNLDIYGIEYEGISAYSSEKAREYDYSGCSLSEVLARWNARHNSMHEIASELTAVFDMYHEAFEHEITRRKAMLSYLQALELDLFEIGAFNEDMSPGGYSDISQKYSKSNKSHLDTRSYFASLFSEPLEEPEDGADEADDDSSERAEKISDIKRYITELKQGNDVSVIDEQQHTAERIYKKMLAAL